MLFEIFIFAAAGLGMEVVFTATLDFLQNRKPHLVGYSSIWYLPLYALAPVILNYAQPFLFTLALPVRGLLYMICFFAVEYPSMGLLRLMLGTSPSEESYYKSRWNIHGLIRLDFAPAYFLLGLILEWMFRSLRHL